MLDDKFALGMFEVVELHAETGLIEESKDLELSDGESDAKFCNGMEDGNCGEDPILGVLGIELISLIGDVGVIIADRNASPLISAINSSIRCFKIISSKYFAIFSSSLAVPSGIPMTSSYIAKK
jgi:hypothetical protein